MAPTPEHDRAERLASALVEELLDEEAENLQDGQPCPPRVAAQIDRLLGLYEKRVSGEVLRSSDYLRDSLRTALGKRGVGPPVTIALTNSHSRADTIVHGEEEPRPWSPPATIGPYEVLEQLGKGASAMAFRGRHTILDRNVAIKFLSHSVSARGKERFLREGRALARLVHPHIVGIHDCGELDGELYMILEYVRGGSLADRLKANREMPQEEALRIIGDVLSGLAAAHENGILHRDIKPANLLITEEGQVKIADFGVAKISGLDGLTRVGASVGTPLYMAPEQFSQPKERPVDERSDTYAVGVVLYELLVGHVPFAEVMNLTDLVNKKHAGLPPIPETLPKWLIACLERFVAVEPEDRYQTTVEALDAFSARGEAAEKPTSAVELILHCPEATHTVRLLPGEPITLGRSSKRADVPIGDQRMSRIHAELRFDRDQVFLRDLGSSNGTYLNGKRLAAAAAITDGDKIVLGDSKVIVECAALAPEAIPDLECSLCGKGMSAKTLLTGEAIVVDGKVVCSACSNQVPIEECLHSEGYRIQERIDDAGATWVFRAMRPSMDTLAALRVLDRQTVDEEFQAQFLADARALARLRHSNAVSVFDIVETSRMICVGMEFVTGEPLGERVARRGKLELGEALQILYAVSSVCELSEGQGLYHGNLSPRSIMIAADGEAKVLGFRLGGDVSHRPPRDLRFVAPERLASRGHTYDQGRADVYSLAANLHLTLTGLAPYHDLRSEVLFGHAQDGTLPPFVPVVPDYPPADVGDLDPLVDFMRRSLSLEPVARPATLHEAHLELAVSTRMALLSDFTGPVETLFSLLSATKDGIGGTSRTVRFRRRTKRASLAGSFSGDELVELIQMLGLNRRTGTLSITAPNVNGSMFLRDGLIIGGKTKDGQTGKSAARRVARSREGEFEFSGQIPVDAQQHDPLNVSAFLLDLMRASDERDR